MMKRLSPHLKGYGRTIALCLLLTLAEVLCELVLPLLMSRIVDVGIASGDIGYMARIGAIMVSVAAGAILFGVLNARFSADASQGFGASLRGELFRSVQSFSFSNIDNFSGASLVTRMTSDVTVIQNTMMMVLRLLTRAPIMLVSAYVIAAGINFRLSLVIVAAIVLLGASVALILRVVGGLFEAMQKKLDAVNATVQENLTAIRVVKAFVREAHERTKFKTVNDALTAASIRATSIATLIMPIMMLVFNGTTIAVIWFGGRFVIGGEMLPGQLISFISYIMQILMSVMMFAMILIMLPRARASSERIVEVLDTQPDIADKPASETARHRVTKGKVEFQNVGFRYRGVNGNGANRGRNVLEEISFTAEPGEFVAIIGGTGSGKTSLVSLIPRFYDVDSGRVLIDGVNVRDYAQHTLRDGIGMVMQKNNLFSGTIRENLLWGAQGASEEALVRAAVDAQAHGFITAFPDGYDTQLGQGGVNVSGGQKQRLCIARAMMKNPPILILDDSTSAVDTATEAKIREAFTRHWAGSTILLVAQRISSVKHADKIIVLDDGRICGIGTHEQLIQANDVYREICVSQNELAEGGVA